MIRHLEYEPSGEYVPVLNGNCKCEKVDLTCQSGTCNQIIMESRQTNLRGRKWI